MAIPTIEPDELVAGETWQWEISDSDYPAGDGWVLTYALLDSATNQIAIVATANGDAHLVDEAFATTAAYTAGTYNYTGFFELAGVKKAARQGCIVVTIDYAAISTDPRSSSQIVLAAIEATIAQRATKAQSEVKLGSGSGDVELKFLSPKELSDWLTFYEDRVNTEKAQERSKQGGVNRRIVRGHAVGVVC